MVTGCNPLGPVGPVCRSFARWTGVWRDVSGRRGEAASFPQGDFGPADLRMPLSRLSWASRHPESEALALRDLFWNADFKLLFQIGKAPNRVNDVNGHLELPMRVPRCPQPVNQ